jgi:hypothetical protein
MKAAVVASTMQDKMLIEQDPELATNKSGNGDQPRHKNEEDFLYGNISGP